MNNNVNIDKKETAASAEKIDKIVICDDDKDIVRALQIYLSNRNYELLCAYTGREALDFVKKGDVSLVLLDIMMPEMVGITALRAIREKSNVPVILITAKSEDADKVLGLDVGADDYITKPFKPSVLYAKCQAILNRSKKTEKEDKETIWLDESKHLMYVDGEAVALPNKEYLLMELFLNNKNQLFTCSQILNKVWGYDYYGDGRAVDTYIKKLRKKLGVHSHRIQTIMKAGYTYTDEED